MDETWGLMEMFDLHQNDNRDRDLQGRHLGRRAQQQRPLPRPEQQTEQEPASIQVTSWAPWREFWKELSERSNRISRMGLLSWRML